MVGGHCGTASSAPTDQPNIVCLRETEEVLPVAQELHPDFSLLILTLKNLNKYLKKKIMYMARVRVGF